MLAFVPPFLGSIENDFLGVHSRGAVGQWFTVLEYTLPSIVLGFKGMATSTQIAKFAKQEPAKDTEQCSEKSGGGEARELHRYRPARKPPGE